MHGLSAGTRETRGQGCERDGGGGPQRRSGQCSADHHAPTPTAPTDTIWTEPVASPRSPPPTGTSHTSTTTPATRPPPIGPPSTQAVTPPVLVPTPGLPSTVLGTHGTSTTPAAAPPFARRSGSPVSRIPGGTSGTPKTASLRSPPRTEPGGGIATTRWAAGWPRNASVTTT